MPLPPQAKGKALGNEVEAFTSQKKTLLHALRAYVEPFLCTVQFKDVKLASHVVTKRFSVTDFSSPKGSGIRKGNVTRKLPKLCRFQGVLQNYSFSVNHCYCLTILWGATLCQSKGVHQIVVPVLPSVGGCMLKKCLQKGGHRHPSHPLATLPFLVTYQAQIVWLSRDFPFVSPHVRPHNVNTCEMAFPLETPQKTGGADLQHTSLIQAFHVMIN